MRNKYPWYVWLSVGGFVYFMGAGLKALMWDRETGRLVDYRRWLPFLGWSLYVLAGQVLLPVILVGEAWRWIPWFRAAVGQWLPVLQLVVLYGTGVAASVRMDRAVRGGTGDQS
jgi:hypothetical protein